MPPANGGSSTPPDTLPADFGNWDANPPDIIPRQLKPLRTFSSAMHYNLGAPPPARTPAQAVQQQVNQAVGTVPSPTRLLDVAGAYPGTMPSKVPANWTGNAQPVPLGASDVASIATDVLAPGTMMPGKADLSPGEETPGQTVGRGVGQLLTPGQRTTGALRTIAGATEAAAPLAGPFAVENPLGFLRAIGEGWLTGKAAKKAASALNASEEQQGLAEQVGQAAPMLYHAALHPEIAQGHTPEGNPVGQATVMGKYGGGVEITPDEVVLRGGSTENPKEIRIPRRPRSPALEPPTIEGQTTAASEPTQSQALAGGPEATPSRNLAPAPPEAPQSPIPAPIRALAAAGVPRKPPQTVGTVQGAQRDTELFQQAKSENPNGTVSQWAQRAQELKQQDEQPPQQALYSPASAAAGEDDMEAARRGAAGAPPSDRVQRATDLVNSLTMQLDRERAAGDPGQYLTVSHLSNAQDALQVAQSGDQLFAGKRPSKEVQAHNAAVGSMLLDVTHPPQSIDWNVVKPGRGLPNALELNDAARELVGKSIGTGFGGVSVSPDTLDTEILPRLEMAAQAMDNTRAQRSELGMPQRDITPELAAARLRELAATYYFDPQASVKLRQLAQAIQENRGPEGMSFTRSEGTPDQQRYTTHEELFHTAVQRRPAGGIGLRVPDISDTAGMELMTPRIIRETRRTASIVHHAEGIADIMQGHAPELTPEQAGQTAEDYWDKLAATGPSGVNGLLDAWRLENFMDDDQERKGYTLDDNVHAIRQAGRDALARVLSRQFGENLRGLARALREEPAAGGSVPRAQGSPNPTHDVSPTNGPPDLRPPTENPAGAGPSSAATSGSVAPPQQESLFSPDAEGNLRRKLNREEDVGDPVQDRAVKLTRKDGKPFYVGRMTPKQWMDKVNSYLTPEQLTEWRAWYREARQHFLDNSDSEEQADRDMMGWLLTQQRASPSAGYQNLTRAKDIASGLPKIKRPGLGEEKIYAALRGEEPQSGLGAKLHDFVDSARGKTTRTWMGDDPRGGGPAVIDVHGGRDTGFVDEPLLNEIKKQFGPDVAARFQADMKGAPTETQYENGSQYYNDLVRQLDNRNFDGGKWRPEEVQAVGWAAQQLMTNRVPQLVRDIFAPSRRTVSAELAFGEGSPYAKEFGKQWESLPYDKQQAITQQVFKKIIEHASREAGGKVIQSISGPGGYQEYPMSPSMQHVIEGSPEAAQRLANVIGYLAQQTEVLVSRPLKSGQQSGIDILEKAGGTNLRDHEKVRAYWNDFRNTLQQQAPKLAEKVQGFMPVEVNGRAGIRFLTRKGKFSEADEATMSTIADAVSKRANIDTGMPPRFDAVAEGVSHDWTRDQTGGQYARNMAQLGRPEVQGRLASASAEVRAEIQRAFQEHAPEAGVVSPGGQSPPPPPTMPPHLRRVQPRPPPK